ncbi:MAG: hypothetical protein MHM6MM_008855, partial [Cercozoa sp. M6MM]
MIRHSARIAVAAAKRSKSLTVVGGGPGGYVAAIKAAQLGLDVTCIEKRGTLGGTCLNVGCIPSKSLLHSSHMLEHAQHSFATHGIHADNVRADVGQMVDLKDKTVKQLTRGIEGLFKKYGVKYVKGAGRLLGERSASGEHQVAVDTLDGGSELVTSENVLLATGSDVAPLPGLEIDEETVLSSTGALALREAPEKLAVIGGGVIGLEMGSVWNRLGSDVTVVEFLPRLCPGVDAECERVFRKALKKQGLGMRLSTKVLGAERTEDGKVALQLAKADSQSGEAEDVLVVDKVLVAIGRRPYTEGLGLDEAGVQLDERGRVVIDEQFRTSAPGVFAIGDVVAGPMLAHKAEEEGIACVENLAGKHGHINYDVIPGVIYTTPEVATVGKSEEELKEQGVEYAVGKFPFVANSRAVANNDTTGMVKLLTDKKTDRILGAHIVHANAGEMIAELVLAMEYGASAEDVARTC